MSEETLDPKQNDEAHGEAAENAQDQAAAQDSVTRAAEPQDEGQADAGEPQVAAGLEEGSQAAAGLKEGAQIAGGEQEGSQAAGGLEEGAQIAGGEEEEGQEPEEPQLPEYGVAVEDVGTLKKKVTVTVPAARIDAKREEMFGELDRTAQVPGFRIGHAPRRLLEKRFGKEVGRDVRNALIGDSLGTAVKKAALQMLGEPSLDLEAIELPASGDLTYSFEVEVAPGFDLPELKGIKVTRPVVEVTDERIDEAIEQTRVAEAKYERAEAPAQALDAVQVSAKITGEGMEERTTTSSLRVAPGQIEGLPMLDLGEQLAGRKAGETVTLTVKVPQVHPTEAWRGKEAKVELTIQEVRRRVLPALGKEFAARHGYDSVEDLRAGLARRMRARIDAEVQQALREQVHEYLLSHTQVELPPEAAARAAARTLQRRYVDLLQAGVPREQIEERLAQAQAGIVDQASRDLKLAFILQRIAEDREVEVTEEEINSRVAQMARAYGRRPERLRQELEDEDALRQVAVAIQEEKIVNALLADAKVVNRTRAKAEAQAEAAADAASGEGEGEAPAQAGGDAPAAQAATPGEAAADAASDEGEAPAQAGGDAPAAQAPTPPEAPAGGEGAEGGQSKD